MSQRMKFMNLRYPVVKEIEGFSHSSLIVLFSKLGAKEFIKFKRSKILLLDLATPNNKVLGVRIPNSKPTKGSGRLKIALRQAANAIKILSHTPFKLFLQK